jgi:toxin-antitoxin system PIN domain toxin
LIAPDVNVLVYAFRDAAPDHDRYRRWLLAATVSNEPLGLIDLVLAGFIRVVTNGRIFTPPTPVDRALQFADRLRAAPNAVAITPGDRHWQIFSDLCREVGAKGNIVPDAWLAALAIESGSELITTDHDFSRFRRLRWRHPLAD